MVRSVLAILALLIWQKLMDIHYVRIFSDAVRLATEPLCQNTVAFLVNIVMDLLMKCVVA